ncbi:MAG: phasin family protein [Geminicoccaceae bacterium]|nr:phasin family protein [Geminicoccaceae bacterium]MCX8100383.1 phasin family protein [Geminicoccaceae bacterium]MDW8369497.1 phasin family protein [Geminicoccaceae bacterium]
MAEQNPGGAAGTAVPFLTPAVMDGWLRASRQWMDLAGRCSARMIAFMGERMQADLELGKKLAECRDMASLARLQGEWLQQTVEHYRRELQATADLVWKGVESMREEVAEAAAAATPESAGETTARARERRAA